jgi:hypothetical protein
MRKYIFALLVSAGLVSVLQAQLRVLGAPSVEENRYPLLGLKAGFYGPAEISYQHPIAIDNRLEVGIQYDDQASEEYTYQLHLRAVYQWMKRDKRLPFGFNYFVGLGAGVVAYQTSPKDNYQNTMGGGILGQIGLEYNFQNVPIQMTIDYRPGYYLNPVPSTGAFIYSDLKLGVRYRF